MVRKRLILFIIVISLKQLLWTAVIPIWQTPDEQAHFAQVQNIAEKNKISNFTTSKEIVISEEILKTKRDEKGNNFFTYNPKFNIKYTNNLIGQHEKEMSTQSLASRHHLVATEASGYPPLYYQIAATGYRLVYNNGLIDRVFFIRIFQSLIYVLTILIYFKCASEILPKKQTYGFLLFISFLPMPSFVAAGITSDNLMNLLFPAVIYLGILIIKNGLKTKYFITFALLALLGELTKPHFIIIVPILWFAILIFCLNNHKMKFFAALNLIGILLFPLLLVFFYPTYLHDFLVTKNIGLLLPEIGDISSSSASQKMNILSYLLISLQKTYRETVPWFWGIFRWLSFTLDRWYYRIFNLITVISLAGGIWYSIKLKRGKINSTPLIIFLLSSVLIYFFVLFLWDYLFFLSHGFSFGIQGRYYFPVLFPMIFLIYHYFPFKKLLPLVSIVFNLYALFEIGASYYDASSFSKFIIQASQYKPWYFKGNYLIFLISAYITVLIVFLIKLELQMSSPRTPASANAEALQAGTMRAGKRESI